LQTVVKDYAVNSSDTSRNENLWIQIINGKTKYIIGGIYRHPSGSLTEFSNNLEETMCKVSKCNVPCIIAGDLNINLLNCSLLACSSPSISTTTLRYWDGVVDRLWLRR